jgi:uncharacterized membrane protein YgdD (TMEM256/DUF423 family)
MKTQTILLTAGILGALAVGLGAFGAHSLEPMLRATGRLDTYETAVKYHFYHTLLLLFIALIGLNINQSYRKAAYIFITSGILLFSGSLYILCLTGITWLGAVTPLGGVALIAGWLALGIGGYKWTESK